MFENISFQDSMAKLKTVFLIHFTIIVLLSACNLLSPQNNNITTSTAVKVRVSVATEYRAGPGQDYDVGGILNPGQEVEVFGRNPNGEYLLIRDPSNPTVFWWIKSEYPALPGNLANLPIYTPPSPSTPISATDVVGGCPTPIGGGPTPVSCATVVPVSGGGCPTPIGGGPTPVSCDTTVPMIGSGCPTPIGGGPTPVSCATAVPVSDSGCPTPIGGGPTPVSCDTTAPMADSGCPTPVGGGPTPVSCDTTVPVSGNGCPTPIGGGPTPVSCDTTVPVTGSGCPTPIGGGPTPVSCSGDSPSTGNKQRTNPTPVWIVPNLINNPTPISDGSGSEPTPIK